MDRSYTTLREALAEWTDFDVAGYRLACCIGLMNFEDGALRREKHVFWSNDAIGNMLYDMLQQMVKTGILEFNAEDQRFRWNQSFQGSWEES